MQFKQQTETINVHKKKKGEKKSQIYDCQALGSVAK